MQEIKLLKDKVFSFINIKKDLDDLDVLIQLVEEENDENSISEVFSLYKKVSKELDKLETENLLSRPS